MQTQLRMDVDKYNEKSYSEVFKRLYYHLYSNSNTSRAERIGSDLSNLLLCKALQERNEDKGSVELFLNSSVDANELLFPLLMESFPFIITDNDKFHLDSYSIKYCLRELEQINLKLAPAHVLGEAFQALIGPRLRGDRGQFFTPRSVVRAMINILAPHENSKIVDPACGTGGFLVECQSYYQNNNMIYNGQMIGFDKDHDLCRMAGAMLEIILSNKSKIVNTNSLDYEFLINLPENICPLNSDYIITNPPFGVNIKITNNDILKQFELSKKGGQDPQILFLELCIKLLKPGGKLGIILPEGVFGNNGLNYVWDYIRSNGNIMALIDCPRTTFQPSTDIKTNILFFEKNGKKRINEDYIWSAIAINCGHDRRGRILKVDGSRYPDDFEGIGNDYKHRNGAGNSFWQKSLISNPYYLVPRYYDTKITDELLEQANQMGAELVSLDELMSSGCLRIRKGNEVGAEVYGTGDIPFVRTSDISNYEISTDMNRGVSEEVYEIYKDIQMLCPKDILLVNDGRYRIGRAAMLHEYNYKCVVQSHIRIISVTKQSPITSIELLYLLSLPVVHHQIRNFTFVQSTLGTLGKRLFEIKIPIPQKTDGWNKLINQFQSIINTRAKLLSELKAFDRDDYEV